MNDGARAPAEPLSDAGPSTAAAAAAPFVATASPFVFARTVQGDATVERGCRGLDAESARVLLLFEEPLTLDEIGAIIDEAWLPSVLIRLERFRLLKRRQRNPDALPDAPPKTVIPEHANLSWSERRDLVRVQFEALMGVIGEPMAARIGACQELDDLDDLMPQIEALLESVAGPNALQDFLEHTSTAHQLPHEHRR